MNTIFEKVKNIFWENKILTSKKKEEIFYKTKGLIRGTGKRGNLNNDELWLYIQQILNIQNYKNKEYIESFTRQALHSKAISFIHPITNKQMLFETDLPKDIKKLIENLKSCFS